MLFELVNKFKVENPNKNISWIKIAQSNRLKEACSFTINNASCRSAFLRFQTTLDDPDSNDSIKFKALSQISNEEDEELIDDTQLGSSSLDTQLGSSSADPTQNQSQNPNSTFNSTNWFSWSVEYPPAKGGTWHCFCLTNYDPCQNNVFKYYMTIPADVEPNKSLFKYERYQDRGLFSIVMPRKSMFNIDSDVIVEECE